MEKKEKQNEINKNDPADFETAVSATGFGKFNYLLLIISLPACSATVFETSTLSYVLPTAECDLRLSLLDKGVLNAITYIGMITSAVIWGFVADTFGRKKLLVLGFLLDSICVFCASISQTKYILMIFKYFGGVLMCGPFAVLMSYMTEFHGTKHRSRIMMCIGLYFSSATIMLPLLAWGILPNDWSINIFNYIVLHSWQLFITTCAIPSFIAGIAITFLPESPKFLMSQGRNDEALKVFQKVFAMNMGKSKEEYPITTLINEVPQKTLSNNKLDMTQNDSNNQNDIIKINNTTETSSSSFKTGLSQVKTMFHKPHLGHSILVYVIQFLILLGLNTLRLWLPQLFTLIADFEQNYAETNSTGRSDLCEMIKYSVKKSEQNIASITLENYICETKIPNQMYINTIIVGTAGLFGYIVAGFIINALGNKRIMITGLAVGGTCALTMFWAKKFYNNANTISNICYCM